MCTCIVLLPLLLISCGPKVATENPSDANLENYNTFAYLPNAVEMDESVTNEEQVNKEIITTINANLRQAGFRMDRDTPDLLVLVSVKADTEVATDTNPVYVNYPYRPTVSKISPYYARYYYRDYSGYSNLAGYDTDTYTYKEGTLVVDLVDKRTKETVWKGFTSASIYNRNTTAAIADLVNQIFDEYPMKRR